MSKRIRMFIERKQNDRWMVQNDLFTNNSSWELNFKTLPHNGLMEAHLLGCFDVMDPGHAPENLDHDLRIVLEDARGIPTDCCQTVGAAYEDSNNGEPTPVSYATLAKIMKFDWTQKLMHRWWLNGPMLLQ